MNSLLVEASALLYREARYLDDRNWDEWLHCYAAEVEFWMPAWDDHDQLVEDPQREVSLIYYPTRAGLEDRVYRIKTERSSASMPEPRTCHLLSNIELLQATATDLEIRYNWQTLSHRYQTTDVYFGTTFCTLSKANNDWLISRKKVVLKNDYIRQVIDIYHI